MTGSSIGGHYRRYDLALHLQSAAVRVPDAYVRFPPAHRPESIEQASRLDRLLAEIWGGRTHYVMVEGNRHIEAKLERELWIIREFMS